VPPADYAPADAVGNPGCEAWSEDFWSAVAKATTKRTGRSRGCMERGGMRDGRFRIALRSIQATFLEMPPDVC